MTKILWVTTNCKTNKEAWEIGNELLNKRLIACFDIVSRVKTAYFWPAGSGKVEAGKGVMLIGVTLPSYAKKITAEIKKLHSDKVSFVGALPIESLNNDYTAWLKGELL